MSPEGFGRYVPRVLGIYDPARIEEIALRAVAIEAVLPLGTIPDGQWQEAGIAHVLRLATQPDATCPACETTYLPGEVVFYGGQCCFCREDS